MKRGHLIIDPGGLTDRSKECWYRFQPLFGEIEEAVAWDGVAAIADISSRSELSVYSAFSPLDEGLGLLLRDAQGNEIWLTGCQAGANTYGSWGAAEVLRSAGFPAEQAELVKACRKLHLRKDHPRGPVEIVRYDR